MIDQLARAAATVPYNAQSIWNPIAPDQHMFQSVLGLSNPKNKPSAGVSALVAAPVASGGCDAVTVEVYPLAVNCEQAATAFAKGGEVRTQLKEVKIVTDAQQRRVILIPGFANTCVAMAVDTVFGPTPPAPPAPTAPPQ